jgi:hypothetical protein
MAVEHSCCFFLSSRKQKIFLFRTSDEAKNMRRERELSLNRDIVDVGSSYARDYREANENSELKN